MFRLHKVPRRAADDTIAALAPAELMRIVRELSFSREWRLEEEANRRAAAIIRARLEEDGRDVEMVGEYRNLVSLPRGDKRKLIVVGAHYDSVLGTPGADDNASAVAVMLGLSRALRDSGERFAFVAFNAEEDGISGSDELAAAWAKDGLDVDVVHVLEMLGFKSDAPGSQQFIEGVLSKLPVPDVADFVGLLANQGSRRTLNAILREARRGTNVPVVALQTYLGVERALPSLDLSDHVRFWAHGFRSVLWTDTAFYRNPNYHLASDTPDTLDPEFMSAIAHLLFRVLLRSVA